MTMNRQNQLLATLSRQSDLRNWNFGTCPRIPTVRTNTPALAVTGHIKSRYARGRRGGARAIKHQGTFVNNYLLLGFMYLTHRYAPSAGYSLLYSTAFDQLIVMPHRGTPLSLLYSIPRYNIGNDIKVIWGCMPTRLCPLRVPGPTPFYIK